MVSVPKSPQLLNAWTISQNIISPLTPLLSSYSLISSDIKCFFAFTSGEQASVRHFREIPFLSRKQQSPVPEEKQGIPLCQCACISTVCSALPHSWLAAISNVYLAYSILVWQGHLWVMGRKGWVPLNRAFPPHFFGRWGKDRLHAQEFVSVSSMKILSVK